MIQRAFKKIAKEIELYNRRIATRRLLTHSVTNEDEQTFLDIVQQLQKNNWTEEERKALNKIQMIRNQYASSDAVVNIVDYGAGKPEKALSQTQMEKGIETQLKVSDIYKAASTSEKFGELMFGLVRSFQPKNCLELGTSLGISGSYQIAALHLNQKGKFTTIEGSSEIADLAITTFQEFNYPNFEVHKGKFNDVLPKILNHDNPLDFVFVDGHHDKVATQAYYERIYPYLSKKAMVIFDDINWSQGMQEVWHQISQKGNGIVTSFDLYYWGVCFVDKSADNKVRTFYKIAL